MFLLVLMSGARAANGSGAAAAVLDCEANTPGGAPAALFREIELRAYSIEGLARECHGALQSGSPTDVAWHLAVWADVLVALDLIDEALDGISAGRHFLSPAQQRTSIELEDEARRVCDLAHETVRSLERSTLGVQAEQYGQALLEIQESSLRMARMISTLDHCGEIRLFPSMQVPMRTIEESLPDWRE